MPIPGDCVSICEGRAPEGNEGCVFFIRESTVDKVQDAGPLWKFKSMELIDGVLQNPVAIYEGLGRDGCAAACCYSGLPTKSFEDDGSEAAAPAGCFFVVYVEPVSGGLIVWDWGWRKEDPDSPGDPIGWKSFGKGKVWPRT